MLPKLQFNGDVVKLSLLSGSSDAAWPAEVAGEGVTINVPGPGPHPASTLPGAGVPPLALAPPLLSFAFDHQGGASVWVSAD